MNNESPIQKNHSRPSVKGTKGGRRPKAGRPRKHSPGVSYSIREKVNEKLPFISTSNTNR